MLFLRQRNLHEYLIIRINITIHSQNHEYVFILILNTLYYDVSMKTGKYRRNAIFTSEKFT